MVRGSWMIVILIAAILFLAAPPIQAQDDVDNARAVVQQWLKQELGKPQLLLIKYTYEGAQWNDSSLGCPKEGETYAEGLVASKLFSKASHFIHSFRGKTIEDTIHIPRRRILAQRLFAHFCDGIITNSEESRKEYATLIGINPDKIYVIYNGVDGERFQKTDEGEVSRRKRQLGIKEKDLVIGTVARFDPVKNLSGLVRAYSSLMRSSLERTKLFLIGDGPDLNAVKTLVRECRLNGRVLFAGMRSDIPECLNMMDIYVQPSLFENVPNTILEAMASGLPVIATDVGGVSEIVEKGITGFLVTPNDESGLAKSIEYLLKNPDKRRDMGALGKERVSSCFSMEKMVSDYENLYEEILKGGN